MAAHGLYVLSLSSRRRHTRWGLVTGVQPFALPILWEKLATRYRDEPWIGGYDLINEPNWSFATPGEGNGCDETKNKAVWGLQQRITAAIRERGRAPCRASVCPYA